MGFAQGRRPLCFFFSRGQLSACCQRRYLCSRGVRGDAHPCVMRRTAQPWPPQASRAGTLASPHAPPRIDAYTSCVYVSYTCVCVCQHVTQQSLVLRVRVRVRARVRVLPEPIRGLFSTLHGCCHNRYGVTRCCRGTLSLECPALGLRPALSKRRSGLFASETMFSFRFCTADAAYPARHRC